MAETHKAPIKIVSRLRPGGGKASRPPAQIAAIDVDGDVLRVAIGTRRGEGVDFTRVAATPISLPEDADRSDPKILGQAISRALSALRLKPGVVAIAVPRREAILRTVLLPALKDERELAAMVLLQVVRDLPYRKEDAVIDFEVRPLAPAPELETPPVPPVETPQETPAPSVPKVDALVAVAQSGVVSFYQQTCEAAGLKLGALTFAPYAHAQCLAACGVVGSDSTVVIVALRSAEVTVDVLRGGKLLFSRDAAIVEESHDAESESAEPGDSAESVDATKDREAAPDVSTPNGQPGIVERVTIEVVRSLHAFTGMAADAIGKIVVVGATGHEAAVVDALAARFTLPAIVLDAGEALKVRSEDREAALGGFSAMGVVIAATDPAGLPFNFLSPKRPPVQRDMRKIRILAAAAAVAVLLIGVFAIRGQLLKQRLLAQQQIQQEITNLTKNQSLYKRTRAQQAAIQEWIKEGRNWLEHYAYLTSILPGSEEIYVTSLTIGSQGGIRLAVQAQSGEVLARLDKQLRDAGYEVKPQAITPGTDRHGYNFRSSFELDVPAKLKIDLGKIKPAPPRPTDDVSLSSVPRSSPAVTVYGGGK